MTVRSLLLSLLLAGTLPAGAGVFDQFADLSALQQHLLSGGPPRDGIPAMTNPEFVPVDEVDYVGDGDLVIGVVRNGVAKAYPENLGWWHEIINDDVGGDFVSITFCPLTGTPQVFDATAPKGSQIEFGVSGLLINSNLVMYDRRDDETLYPQMIYTGINGDFKDQRLQLEPAIVTTLAMWRQMYPDSQVALFGTGLDRYRPSQQENYQSPDRFQVYPYGDYRSNDGYFIAPLTTGSPDLSFYGAKEVVLGLCIGPSLRAYPFADMVPQAVINDTLGGQSLLVVFDLDSGTAIPYSRLVDGRELTFFQVEAADGELPVAFMDVQTRSRWDLLGRAVDGPLQGAQLAQLPAHNAMWFAWSVFWPETTVYQPGDGVIEDPGPDTAVLEPVSAAVPAAFALEANHPNPFNPSTRIGFRLPAAAEVTLEVYNTAGQRLRILAAGRHLAGRYEVAWDGRDQAGTAVASGTYIYHLEAPAAGWSESRRMTLAR